MSLEQNTTFPTSDIVPEEISLSKRLSYTFPSVFPSFLVRPVSRSHFSSLFRSFPPSPFIPSIFPHRPDCFPTPSGTLRSTPCSSANTVGLIAHERIERFPSHYTRES